MEPEAPTQMIDPKLIDDLAKRLAGTVPEGLRSLQQDIESNFKPVLRSMLGRLDLVTREEFDVQRAVLARTRAKLDELTARLDDMESGGKAKRAKTGKKKGKSGKKKTD